MTKIEILNQYKKQKHNTYRECDVINAMEKYLESYKQDQALQLQQTGVSGSDSNKFGKKTKTEKGKTDCDECKFNDGSNDSACFSCPDKIGFGYHYR